MNAWTYKKFSDGTIVAQLWWCEDPVCDCHQPQVVFRGTAHVPMKHYPSVRLWEGEFHSQPNASELKQMEAELAEAAERFGVEMDNARWGTRPATDAEIRDNERRYNERHTDGPA